MSSAGRAAGGVGDSPPRPDGTLKVLGQFAYGSDLWMDGMIWGVTLRSPHPSARINSIDIGPALATAGVHAVLTHADVPGVNRYGLDLADQPVLAEDVVRYQGEPVAIVAADHPEIARRAAKKIVIDYEVLDPVTDAVAALQDGAPAVQPGGNLVRHLKLRKGAPGITADVVVRGSYQVGMQDQAFLGPEAGLAVPDGEGGVDLHVATQWLHVDQRQVCAALGLPPDRVRLTLAGVGGAFGGREDLSMHVHACLLALHTGKPVKMSYNREESFFGHVHRHPATMSYEHGADRDGRLVYVRAELWLDGGAYASSTPAVVGNAGTMGIGPYIVPNVHLDAYGVYTNNPPCGAMRGFGAVQAAFAYEAQMDKLAAALGMDPVELRCINGMSQGAEAPTGQIVDSPAPVAELLRLVQARPLPPELDGQADVLELPGGAANTTHGEGVIRGVGYAVAYKNVGFSEGYDDYSTARVRLELAGDEPTVTVHTAAAEVGQGLITVEEQICRTELGVHQVVSHPKDTTVGSGGSTSASRQTYVTGGAVQAACRQVRERVFVLAEQLLGRTVADLRLADGEIISDSEGRLASLAEVLRGEVIEETVEWRHRPDVPAGPGDRAGLRARAVRVRGAPRRGRRGHRAWPGQGRRAGLRAGRRQGDEPRCGARPDPRWQRAGPWACRHGGDPGLRRTGEESLVHRLPDPHHPGHAADAGRCARVPGPARPVRAARRGRAADHLLRARDRRRHQGSDRPWPDQDPDQARAPHQHVMADPAA